MSDSFLNINKLIASFPFPFRGNQKKAIEDIGTALNRPEIKYVVLQAPTGSGKSPIAVAAAKAVNNAFVLTSNKILQDQYQKDFLTVMADLRGRSNYRCEKFSGHNCANSPCRATPKERIECKKAQECEYHFALGAAKASKVTSLNFAAAVAFLNYTEYFKDQRDLMIIDEAHLIQDNLTNVIEFSINTDTLNKLMEVSTIMKPDIPKFETAKEYLDWLNALRAFMTNQLENFETPSGMDMRTGNNISYDLIEGFNAKLQKICLEVDADPENFVVEQRFVDTNQTIVDKISFKPIDISEYANEMMFRFGKKTLMMSATIINYEEFIKNLGIKPEEAVFIDLPSTFPKGNRPIIRNYIDSFNHANMEKSMPKIIQECRNVLKAHKDEKGIIHTHTYTTAKAIYNALKFEFPGRLLFPENSFKQKEILLEHGASKDPTVLISPSMTEGVDLKDDLSRWQIIVKIPYPSLGDKIVKARMALSAGWYGYKTALTIIQAYGRSTRTETDHSVTYILDANFEKLVNQQRKSLPLWFLQAIM